MFYETPIINVINIGDIITTSLTEEIEVELPMM